MSAQRSRWFCWSPSSDTLVAVLTEIAMMAAYWTVTHLLGRGWDVVLVLGIGANLGLNVFFPVWWLTCHRRQPLSELGITTRRWLLSLLVGAGLAALSSFRLRQMAAGTDWLPHVLYNALILWEPFFVYGWLQLRFDRAFGIVPGVILAALSFAAYHIGSYPPAELLTLLIAGLLYGVLFRLTSNLLILWPLLWSIGSSIGTLMGGMQFTWIEVVIWAVILLLQLGTIGYVGWRRHRAARAQIGVV
jgi:membrane protease YdiL (CAAX protease family)